MRAFCVALVLALALSGVSLAGSRPAPAETDVVPTGEGPCGITAHGGALWVGTYGAGTAVRIDAATGRVTRRIRVGQWACRVAVDGRALWVTRDRAGSVVRVDLATGRQRRLDLGAQPWDIVVAAGSVWVSSLDVGTVARLDTRSGDLVRVYKDGESPAGLAFCRGRIWVGHARDATWLTALDPATHQVHRFDVATKSPAWPRCVRGELWVTAEDVVLKVDARSGKVLGRLQLGGTPAEAGAGPDGLVWVTDKERSRVYRVYGPRMAVTGSFPAGPGTYSQARVGNAMWVTSFAGSDVRRYEP